jgi:NADH-quinone oxidoreductase subunit L
MGIPHLSWIEHWLSPVIPVHHSEPTVAPQMEWVLMAISVLGAVCGIAAAWGFYSHMPRVEAIKNKMVAIHGVLFNKWYIDEIFEKIVVRPIHKMSMFFWKGLDVMVIDRAVLGVGRLSEWTGQTARILQNGSVQFYALALLFGLVSMAGYLIYGYF